MIIIYGTREDSQLPIFHDKMGKNDIIYFYKGGIDEWQAAGLPVEGDKIL